MNEVVGGFADKGVIIEFLRKQVGRVNDRAARRGDIAAGKELGFRKALGIGTVLAASSALDGRFAEARKATARLRQLEPALRLSNLADLTPLRRSEDFARLAKGLGEAGLPK